MKKAKEYSKDLFEKPSYKHFNLEEGSIEDDFLKVIKQAQFDMLEEFEFLITLNEDDFDRGKGKYILKNFIKELREELK